MNERKRVELLQERHRAVRMARELYDDATESGRKMTSDEQRRFDELMEKADRLDAEAADIQRHLQRLAADELRQLGLAADDGDPDSGLITRDQSYGAYLKRRGWQTDLDAEVAESLERDPHSVQVFRALFTGQPRNELEQRVLSAGVNASGGFTVPEIVVGQIIDFARARSVAIQSGARTIPMESGTVHYPRVTAEPTFAWTAENATSTSMDPTFGRWTANAKTLRGIIRGSQELFQDSAADMEATLVRLMGRKFAQQLDAAVIVGASTSGGPTGIMEYGSTDGVNVIANRGSTASAVGLLNYKPLVDAYEQIAAANLDPNGQNARGISAVMSPRSYAGFGNLRDANEQPMGKPPVIEDMALRQTSAVPNTLSTGNGSELVVGDYQRLLITMRLDPTFTVLRERYASEYQLGLLGAMRADSVLEYRDAFTRVQHVGASTFA